MKNSATASRVPDPGIRALFETEARHQAWLDVEAALALAEAELGIIPDAAAADIVRAANLESLDQARIDEGLKRTGHPLVPLIWELARIAGEDSGHYVHWGATTQNITDTGEVLLLARSHRILLDLLADVLTALADLAERTRGMPAAGRTHGQHAVPVTFGYKVAVWIDELARHGDRLAEAAPRLFVCSLGGAAGTFASFGADGFDLQARFAARLGLRPMPVPSRTILDHFAEFACLLGMLGATSSKLANEVYTLMKQEFAEAREPVPAGTVGSSTMPQKRNPILAQDIIAAAAEIRALVPLALEAMQTEHEANRATSLMLRNGLARIVELAGDILARLKLIAEGLTVDAARMRANLDLSGGLILAEALMLRLGQHIGRQDAHDVIYDATEAAVASGRSFAETLAADPKVTAHLSVAEIDALLDPTAYTGLCADMATEQARHGRIVAKRLNQVAPT